MLPSCNETVNYCWVHFLNKVYVGISNDTTGISIREKKIRKFDTENVEGHFSLISTYKGLYG